MPDDASTLQADCQSLAQQFCLLADAADADGVAALFAVDGVFRRGALRVEGRDAIAGMVGGRAPDVMTRHLLTTRHVEARGPTRAAGVYYCLVYVSGGTHDPSAPIVREYHDDYVLTEEGWRIAARTVHTPFEAAGAK